MMLGDNIKRTKNFETVSEGQQRDQSTDEQWLFHKYSHICDLIT